MKHRRRACIMISSFIYSFVDISLLLADSIWNGMIWYFRWKALFGSKSNENLYKWVIEARIAQVVPKWRQEK